MMLRKVLIAALLTGSLLTTAIPAAQAMAPAWGANTTPDGRCSYNEYTYCCQKQDCYGNWCTVYTCDDYGQAMDWYYRQPNNARVLAVKN
jgi:hypothetical protein